MRRLVLSALLSGTLASGAAAQTAEPFAAVREHYLAAVRDAAAIQPGLQALDQLRAEGRAPAGSAADGVAGAYRGALVTLRAKHGTWPPDRLRHLRRGLALLDAAVAAHPDHPEIRFLRLMSCFYLPGLLGRGGSVRDDFAALGRVLPSARDAFPPHVYAAMARFVLEHGGLAPAERQRLEAALGTVGDA